MKQLTFALLAFCAFVPAALAAPAAKGPNLHDGQWETTMTIHMPGLPVAIPPVTASTCITKKEVVPQTNQPGQNCKIKNQKITDDIVEWTSTCTDQKGGTMEVTGKITYKGDTFEGEMKMNMSGGPTTGGAMSYTMTGKRTGDCKPEAK